jgi:hypothetical protein
MADAPEPIKVPNIYSDNFSLAVGPYGAALTFGLTHPEPAGTEGPRVYPAATIRVSLEHLKVMGWIIHRQISQYQKQFDTIVALPETALKSVDAPRDQWRSFWGE